MPDLGKRMKLRPKQRKHYKNFLANNQNKRVSADEQVTPKTAYAR